MPDTRNILISRRNILALFICVAIFALGQFHRASGSIFAPILIDRFSLSATTVASLVSVMFLANVIAQVPMGSALDKYGPRYILSLCILTIGIGTLLFAFAASYETLFVARLLIGLGMASMGAASHLIIAHNFPQRDFGYVSGLVVTLGGIGGLLGTFPLAVALQRLSWEIVFGVAAIFSLILAVIVVLARELENSTEHNQEKTERDFGYIALMKQPEFLRILVLSLVCYAPIVAITGIWGGPYLQDVLGLSAEISGMILLGFYATTICAGFIFGSVDRSQIARYHVILGSVAISAGSLFTLALLPPVGAVLPIGLLALMIFFQQFYIPLGAHMRKVVPVKVLGRASTLMTLVAVAAISAMQLGFGIILDVAKSYGFAVSAQYSFAFAAMGVMITVCGIIYAFSRDVNEA